ncbi:MAG: ATP-binding protein [Fibrobacteraceae bacterium]|nr:ATP-binding protein [Fibrobacteraceae bacterium]
MSKQNYIRRIIDSNVINALETFGAVCIEGPKWCGKTWTSEFHAKSKFGLGDPKGNFQNRQLAEMDPSIVLEGENPRLIDEWQEVPSIWDAVRFKVDETQEKGLFILTGSSTPRRKGILHSGAGRIAKMRLRTMSLFESGASSGLVSLQDICSGKMKAMLTGDVNLKYIIELIVRGGWPGNLNLTTKQAMTTPDAYIRAIIDDDMERLDGIKRDATKMMLLLRSLARNESTTATNKILKNDIKAIDDEDIDVDTVATYLDMFKRLFLIENQPPYSSKIRSRVRIKQAEKRHLTDPSLAVALLKATPEKLLGDLNTLGFLFESLCERDLDIYASSFGGKLFHYQDYRNNEIDAVIEMPDGGWTAFEIKLGANQVDAAAANLIKIRDEIATEAGGVPPSNLCVICGLSNAAYQRPDGVFVVPITALRD